MVEHTDRHSAYGGRSVTLVELREQQYSLNMQILLAIQTHDDAARTHLEEQLAELQEQIRHFGLPEFRRQRQQASGNERGL